MRVVKVIAWLAITIMFFQYGSAVIHKFTWDMQDERPLVSMEQLESLIALSSAFLISHESNLVSQRWRSRRM